MLKKSRTSGSAHRAIIFNGSSEVINVLDSQAPVLGTLLGDKNVCPLILQNVSVSTQLGIGTQGAIFTVTVDDDSLQFVVKKAPFFLDESLDECVVENDVHVCWSSSIVEYILGVLLSPRFLHFPGFINVFSVFLCDDSGNEDTYLFMERVNGGTLKNMKSGPDSKVNFESCVIQTIFCILKYQTLKICHNDLHSENVMWEESVSKVQNFCYIVSGEYYFFPAGEYISKIIDFGFGAKYSDPKIILDDVRNSSLFPKNFTKWYDLLFFLRSCLELENKHNSTLVTDIFRFISGEEDISEFILNRYNNNRPVTLEVASTAFFKKATPKKVVTFLTNKVTNKENLPTGTLVLAEI